jgi:hypothetical protein
MSEQQIAKDSGFPIHIEGHSLVKTAALLFLRLVAFGFRE